MKKTGFTLIELLAIIVILAIIALIAIPVVVNIINDSKKSSEKESIKLYLDHAQKTIAKVQMQNSTFNPSECYIRLNGILECVNGDIIYDPVQVEIKGQMPKSGTIKFSKGTAIEGVNLELNGTFYQMSNNKVSEEKVKKSYRQYITLKEDIGTTGLSVGDKYEYEVKPGKKHAFYILSIEDKVVNLIMDRNICNNGTPTDNDHICNYAWHKNKNNNNYGPDTAMTELYKATKEWINVPNIIMNYFDENNKDSTTIGYTSIITDSNTSVTTIVGKQNKTSENQSFGTKTNPLKARLPMESEVTVLGCNIKKTNNSNFASCPAWLVENLYLDSVFSWCVTCVAKYTETPKIAEIYGYWLLSSYLNEGAYASVVRNEGNINYSNADFSSKYGIRPVITVPINDLSSKSS